MSGYSLDLRERVLAFIDEGQTYKDAVETFKISYSCVRALVRLRDETGTVNPRPHGGGNPGKLKPEDLVLLRQLCEEHPDAYLRELADMLEAKIGLRVQPPALCERLKSLGLTRKKKAYMQPNRTHRKYWRNVTPSAKRSPPSIQKN
jgi:transposase